MLGRGEAEQRCLAGSITRPEGFITSMHFGLNTALLFSKQQSSSLTPLCCQVHIEGNCIVLLLSTLLALREGNCISNTASNTAGMALYTNSYNKICFTRLWKSEPSRDRKNLNCQCNLHPVTQYTTF